MEVTHVRDHVTHAVIGGKQAESFGISDDPAFFHVLSSTLYRDKLRAVVRETMCNAWDAHIEAGLMDMPIEVTLTTTKLIIQDFGFGIDAALIKPIYGVYGASTKKKNQNVTGGFGLGCKAPFAYVDHFEVTSCHQGEKTVYRMSKSSGAVMGKPSIQPIVSVPTDDTGITVSISVLCGSDYSRFEKLIRQIAFLGEMKVKLNGQLLPVAPFSEAKHDYVVLKAEHFGEGAEHPIQVRYGNVTYPIEINDEYKELYKSTKEFMRSIRYRGNNGYYRHEMEPDWVLVLQAQPDTISVTPSRESLSMTDHTIETIKALLEKFMGNVGTSNYQGGLENVCLDLLEKSVKTAWLIDNPVNLLKNIDTIPNPKALDIYTKPYITDVVDVGGYYLRNQYPKFRNFQHQDIMLRLNSLIQSGFGKKGLIQTYRAEYLRLRTIFQNRKRGTHHWPMNTPMNSRANRWLVRRVFAPLRVALLSEKLLDYKRLFVWTNNIRNGRGYTMGYGTLPIEEFTCTMNDAMPFLRGLVVVAHNRRDVEERTPNFPAVKFWYGNLKNSLCYIVPRSNERSKAAVAFFEKQGFTVIDLTKKHSWEHEEVLTPIVKAKGPVKKRPKGFLMLSALGTTIDVKQLFDESAPRIEKPEFWVQISPRQERIQGFANVFKGDCVAPILRLYGSKGGVIKTASQLKKVQEAGAVDIKEYVFEKLLHDLKTNPEIKDYYENSIEHSPDTNLDWREQKLYNAILNDKVLRQEFKLSKKQPSQNIIDIAAIIGSFSDWEERYYPKLKEINDLRKTWTLNPEANKLAKMIDESPLMDIINKDEMAALISTTGGRYTAAQKDKAREFLLYALKG